MGAKTLAGLKEHGAVYLNAIGGAAQFYARSIQKVDDVSLLEFGTPEAMWHLTVKDFPAIVTMDAHGKQPAQGRRAGIRSAVGSDRRVAARCDHATTTINAEPQRSQSLFSKTNSANSAALRLTS